MANVEAIAADAAAAIVERITGRPADAKAVAAAVAQAKPEAGDRPWKKISSPSALSFSSACSLYLGVHKKINAALDNRAARISAELAEAERLRAEAEAVLASFERARRS